MTSSSSSPPPRRRRLRIQSSCPPSDSDLEERHADVIFPCPMLSQVLERSNFSSRSRQLDVEQDERERSPRRVMPSEGGSDAERQLSAAAVQTVPATSQQGLTDRSTPVDDGESSSSAIEAAHCPVLCGACRTAYQPGGDCCSRAAAISLRLQQQYSSSAAFAGSSVQFCLGIMRGVISERESYIQPHFPVIATRPCQFHPLKTSIEDMDRSSITCGTCTEYRRCMLHRNAVVCRHCVCSQLCLHHSWELSSLSTQIGH